VCLANMVVESDGITVAVTMSKESDDGHTEKGVLHLNGPLEYND
jgi:hypothetical protein